VTDTFDTVVQVHLDCGAGWRKVGGWKVEICGVPMVAHRSVLHGNYDPARLSEAFWTITEPRTGASLWCGSDHWTVEPQSIEVAVERATEVATALGGAEGIEAKVAERLADPRYGPAPTEAEAA
jgi:hypothetical protein